VNICGSELYVRYSDNGKGVSLENCSKIFEPFYTTARGTGGTGLGLYIVYNIVGKMNGSIRYIKSDAGFKIEISIPIIDMIE
jgi:signal transduction histidine kinase